jgi:hypothetical protein
MRAERPSSPMIKPLISDWGLILVKVKEREIIILSLCPLSNTWKVQNE